MTAEERRGLGQRVVAALVPPLVLIVAVLGSIVGGVATPTESASVGSLGALFLAVARDHRLAAGEVATREDLAGEAVLTLGSSFSLHQQVLALCEQTGARFLRSYGGTSLDALRPMAGMGMGIAVLPALDVRSEIGPHVTDVKVLRLEQPWVTRSIGLIARKGRREPSQERIAEAIRAVVRAHYRAVLTLEA